MREPAHAGSAYPDDREQAREQLSEYMQNQPAYTEDSLLGIAAPHVSPFGGWESLSRCLCGLDCPTYREKTFVILGTSHYGEPDRFGLTRKPLLTPFGKSRTDVEPGQRTGSEGAGRHSHGRLLPRRGALHRVSGLCSCSIYLGRTSVSCRSCADRSRAVFIRGGKPEDNEHVKRFFGALGDIAAREQNRLCWVLGIDMAHMGRRYGDAIVALADRNEMLEVAERDQARIERVSSADAGGLLGSGAAESRRSEVVRIEPAYTFLKACARAPRGNLRRYQQWNIDEQSVVSFAAMTFHGDD